MSTDSPPDDAASRDALRLRDLTRQNKRLKQVVRTFLTSDTLTATQRQALISVLAGLEDGRRGAYPLHTELSEQEVRLVHNLRTLRPAEKRLVTSLVRQLVKKGGA